LRKSLAGERPYYEGHYQATLSDALGWIVLISAPSRDHFGNIVGGIGIVQDSTARKQTEDALQQQLLFSDALNKISKTVIEKEDRDLILAEVAGVIGETLRIDRAIIYEVSFASNRATGLCEWLNPVHPEMQSARTTISLGQFIGTANHIWKTRNGITSQKDKVNTHFQEDGCSKMLHQDWNIQSLIWHPMAFYQEGFYLLTLSQVYSHREWTKEEIDFLDSVSKLIQIALEKIRLLAEHKKTESDMRVAAFAFESQEGMLITDENNLILRVNQSFTHITGYTVEEVLGKNPSLLASGRHDAHFFATLWESLNVNGTWEGEIWNRRKNGEIFPEHMIITAVRDTHNCLTNYVATFNDITDSKAAEEEIRNLAFYDPLTRLPNRRLLTDRMSHAFASSARSGRKGALLFLDLDNFKTLNDTLGHVMGDLLLQQVAQRLCSCVREGDTVVRLGGDEFVVMLEDLSELSFEAAAQTETIGEKILTTLNVPYQLAEREFRNTPSIGATLFNGHQNGVDDLFKQADIAMYQSKKAGRNTLRFFDPKMQDTINTRVALEGELNQALANHQFHLYFQIQVNSLNKPIGAETLIRWLHPIRGLVSPAQFIPLAEETGLILSIGEWVLETACAQLKAWQNCELTCNLALAVNVSAQQFRLPNFVVQVSSMVQHYAINPKLLKLELTESMLLEDIEDIISTMSALKEIGVRFSLDDFGTGYSSLQYLKRLPLNQLKIDQSFVRDLVIDKSDKAIVRTIIAMAHSLDLNVIAEGVETEEQRLSLIEMNCSLFQGYLFGKPVPIVEFESLLSNISKEYY
jgi:diguanylate cyclase (GGDEF)-like protein/PAS domain S-box-containing protein